MLYSYTQQQSHKYCMWTPNGMINANFNNAIDSRRIDDIENWVVLLSVYHSQYATSNVFALNILISIDTGYILSAFCIVNVVCVWLIVWHSIEIHIFNQSIQSECCLFEEVSFKWHFHCMQIDQSEKWTTHTKWKEERAKVKYSSILLACFFFLALGLTMCHMAQCCWI